MTDPKTDAVAMELKELLEAPEPARFAILDQQTGELLDADSILTETVPGKMTSDDLVRTLDALRKAAKTASDLARTVELTLAVKLGAKARTGLDVIDSKKRRDSHILAGRPVDVEYGLSWSQPDLKRLRANPDLQEFASEYLTELVVGVNLTKAKRNLLATISDDDTSPLAQFFRELQGAARSRPPKVVIK